MAAVSIMSRAQWFLISLPMIAVYKKKSVFDLVKIPIINKKFPEIVRFLFFPILVEILTPCWTCPRDGKLYATSGKKVGSTE